MRIVMNTIRLALAPVAAVVGAAAVVAVA